MPEALDALDVALLELIEANPRISVLELARLSGVARATVTARMQRWRASGVVTGYGPQVDLDAAGFPVQAFATLQIAQGRLDKVAELLGSLPGVVQAYSTTGSGDVLCHLAARTNEGLQQLLLELNRSEVISRTTSVVVLSELVARRTLPLLAAHVASDRTGQT